MVKSDMDEKVITDTPIQPQTPQDADYEAYTKEKIEQALAKSKADPDGGKPIKEIWEKYGLEYNN